MIINTRIFSKTKAKDFTGVFLKNLFLLLLLIPFCSQAYATDILKNISYNKKGGLVEILAELAVPFSYVKHFPRKRGKIIQIQIKPGSKELTKGDVNLKRREMIQPDASAPVAIRDVIYEGNVRGGPYLVFRFTQIVEFKVDASKNSTILRVMVKSSEVDVKPVVKAVKKESDNSVEQLMRDARSALTNGKNAEAILLFSKLLQMGDHKYMSDAREYLGLARERNGQLDMAKHEYEEYLKLYPKAPRASTVRQRLMTLNARLAAPKRVLKESKRQVALRKPGQSRIDIFGSVSQTYYYGAIKTESSETRDQQNSLLSFFDASRRERDKHKETRLVFRGSHEVDILESYRMEARVRSAYGEYKNKENGLEVTLGRQTVNRGGVLGRFDGGLVGVKLRPKLKAYMVGGWPVDFINHQEVQTNKPMFGGRLDLDNPLPNWTLSGYGIKQLVDGITNRFAIGGEVRYFHDKKIFFSLVDYDVSYQKVNFLTLHYGWQATPKIKFDVHYDRRRSPVMLTTNALQGLSVQSVAEDIGGQEAFFTQLNFPGYPLKNRLPVGSVLTVGQLLDLGIPEAKIRDQAIRNTGVSTLMTFTARHSLKKDLTMNTYLTLSEYVPGVNLVAENDPVPKDTSFLPSNLDYSVSTQLIHNHLYKPRDILLGGLRYSNNENSKRFEVNSTYRIPLRKKWWTDYKVRVMYTINKEEGKRAARLSPRFKLDYRYTRRLTFDTSVGVDYNKSQFVGQDYTLLMFNAGFRYLF